MEHDYNIETELKYIRRDLDEIKLKLNNNYVTQDQFAPVKSLVYGLVALLLTAVIGAMVTLVLRV